ncbi:MAG: hypothetical protein AAGB05_14685 [Pseudomonadota bacterium]
MPNNLTPTQLNFVEKYILCMRPPRVETDFGQAHDEAVVEADALKQRLLDMGVGRTAPDTIAQIDAFLARAHTARINGEARAAYDDAQRAMQMALHEVLEYDKGKETLRTAIAGAEPPDQAIPAERAELQQRLDQAAHLMVDPVADTSYGRANDLFLEFLEIKQRVIETRATQRAEMQHAVRGAEGKIAELQDKLTRLAGHHREMAMESEAKRLDALNQTVKAAVEDGSAVPVNDTHPNAATLTVDLGALEVQIDAELDAKCRAALPADHGCTDEEVNALIALGVEDRAAMDAAYQTLRDLDQSLNGAGVDRHNLDARAQATEAAWKEINRKKEAAQRAEDAMEDAMKDLLAADHAVPMNADPVRDAAAIQLRAQMQQALDTRRNELLAAQGEVTTAEAAHADAKAKEKAAHTKRNLLDAVRFGPLSPGHGRQINAPHAAELIALYGENADVAEHALSVAINAQNPESVVTCAQTVCARIDSRFAARDGSRLGAKVDVDTYAQRLISMSAHIPHAEAVGLAGYLDAGRHLQADAMIGRQKKNGKTLREETGKARADYVGQCMLKNGQPMDLAAGRAAMQDLMFNPLALKSASPAQIVHMLDTVAFLENSPAAQAIVNTAQVPTDAAAVSLVAKTTNMKPANVKASHTGEAILTAMMTPVYQGKVGSCFVTAGILKMRQEQPLETMQRLAELAHDGTFQPETGDALAAVTILPDGENALFRSFEYTAATAVARLEDGLNKALLEHTATKAVATLSPKFKKKKNVDVQNRIVAALNDAFDFVYDARTVAKGTMDGSSTHGGTKLVDRQTGKVIENERDFLEVAVRVVHETVSSSDTKFFVSPKDVAKRVIGDDFRLALRETHKPWEPFNGGLPDESARVLEGGDHALEELAQPTTKANMDPVKRAETIMIGLLETGGGMQGVGVSGGMNHAFNALPEHPSFAPLKGRDTEETAANIQRELIEVGAEVRDREIPLAKAVCLFEKQLTAFASKAQEPAKSIFKAALVNKVPTAPITSRELALLLKEITETAAEVSATDFALLVEEREEAKRIAKLNDMEKKRRRKQGLKPDKLTPTEAAEWQARRKAELNKMYEKDKAKVRNGLKHEWDSELTDHLIDNLGLPEFVVADSNWGDPAEHLTFVIAPDPETGLPQFFNRKEPSGKLRLAEEDADHLMTGAWTKTT